MGKVVANLSGLKELEKTLNGLSKKTLQAGWFDSAKYDDGTPVAGVAAVQEFGSPKMNIPAAGFVRQTIDAQQKTWSDLVASGAKAVVNGKATYEQVLSGLGLQVQGDIQESIINTNRPALSPITIALRRLRNDGAKVTGSLVGAVAAAIARGEVGAGQLGDQSFGNKDPLRDTGYMLAAVSYEVS
jgi:uncharacterized protein YcfJ